MKAMKAIALLAVCLANFHDLIKSYYQGKQGPVIDAYLPEERL